MKPRKHNTLRDLAAHLGVSPATVSRALRHDPRITEAVRLRVAKAAAKLGYRRDPKLSQLMSHVRATKQHTFQGTLAWITDYDLDVPVESKEHELYWTPAVRRSATSSNVSPISGRPRRPTCPPCPTCRAAEFPEQRCQRCPPRFSGNGGEGAREVTRRGLFK
jgi:transcriptional regulator with XRE-family HTH domain